MTRWVGRRLVARRGALLAGKGMSMTGCCACVLASHPEADAGNRAPYAVDKETPDHDRLRLRLAHY